MRYLARVLPVAVLLLSTTAGATKIPIPIDDATLNLSLQLQPWVQVTQNGAPDGTSPNWDAFMRRERTLINGDIGKNFSYLLQFDQPNWGKKGNYSLRAYVQDAWVGWAPTGITGGTVVYIDAGLLLLPISRHYLQSTTDYITVDAHVDSLRGMRETLAFRDTGVSIRGWAFDKKVGFRGGIYEGLRGTAGAESATNPLGGINPHGNPRLGAFVNVDLVGTEEGAWLYHGIYFTDKPIVSVGGGVIYQSLATRGVNGVTDMSTYSFDAFADLPIGHSQELTVQLNANRNNYGLGNKDTGWGAFVDVGYRIAFVMPYVSYELFSGDACAVAGIACPAANTADSRVFRGGLDFFINKNLNHVKAELTVGRSNTNLVAPSLWSLTGQWQFMF